MNELQEKEKRGRKEVGKRGSNSFQGRAYHSGQGPFFADHFYLHWFLSSYNLSLEHSLNKHSVNGWEPALCQAPQLALVIDTTRSTTNKAFAVSKLSCGVNITAN